MKKNNIFKTSILFILIFSLLTGCSLGREAKIIKKYDFNEIGGIIDYQQSSLGIDKNSNNVTNQLKDGMFYVLDNETYYPIYFDYKNYEKIPASYVEKERMLIFNPETIVNIPTLFTGSSLYYFSKSGVTDYFTVERYKDLGWSLGLCQLKNTKSNKHVYLDFEDDSKGEMVISPDFDGIKNLSGSSVLLDKIGGVRVTPDFIENGIVVGLTPGATYDVEIYNGTNYNYYNADCNIRYFQAMELYALDEYEPLQDYLYEVKIPEYLLPGYYNFNNLGLVRIVKNDNYDEFTEFNEKLLYQYTYHQKEDDSLKEKAAPYIYSENEFLNQFKAYDETCFGYIDETYQEEQEMESDILLNKITYFKEASLKEIEIWFPKEKNCTISVNSEEKTGSIFLIMDNGNRTPLVYNRLTNAYELTLKGRDFKGILEIKGLYNSYKIVLKNAQSYKEQDKLANIEETTQTVEE